MNEGKNYNPTGKDVFVLYQCPTCKRTDNSCIPPIMKTQIPFFIECDCGGYVMYQKAWIVEPYTAGEVLAALVTGNTEITDNLKPDGKFKEVTDKLDPQGTLDMKKTLHVDINIDDSIDYTKGKKLKKNRKIRSAKMICCLCENEFIIKDIDLYMERINESWNVMENIIKKFPEAQREKIRNTVLEHNNMKNMKKQLKEKGHIRALCLPCCTKMSWSQQLKLGL